MDQRSQQGNEYQGRSGEFADGRQIYEMGFMRMRREEPLQDRASLNKVKENGENDLLDFEILRVREYGGGFTEQCLCDD